MKLNSKNRLASAAIAKVMTIVPACAADVDVLLSSIPCAFGLAELGADFEAATGLTASIEVVGQDVFENRGHVRAGPLDACLVNGDHEALRFFAETGMMACREDPFAAADFDAPRPPGTRCSRLPRR